MEKLGMADYQLADKDYAQYLNQQKIIIQNKPLLRYCYEQWYQRIKADVESIAHNTGDIVELGSGGGYLKKFIPDLITSDVIAGVADRVIKAPELPLKNNSVKALILVQVFHHIPNVSVFLKECERVLIKDGLLLIVDPSHTPVARLLLKNFHTEPYDDTSSTWDFKSSGKATDANQANTWNIFKRDHNFFKKKYPSLRLQEATYFHWVSYILSGGVSGRNLVPNFLAKSVFYLEHLIKPINKFGSLMWYLKITKV